MARMQLGQAQPANPGQPGYAQQPQAGPLPGYAQQPRSGPLRGPGGGGYQPPSPSYGSVGDDLAGMAVAEGARFVGRMIGKRVQAAAGQAQAALAQKRDAMLRTQIAIADKHPDICACLGEQVIFLAGGQKTLPMPNLATLTVEQADELVAALRSG
jgi:hypothetical protein